MPPPAADRQGDCGALTGLRRCQHHELGSNACNPSVGSPRASEGVPVHYERHRPEKTTPHRPVQEQARTAQATGASLSQFVRDVLALALPNVLNRPLPEVFPDTLMGPLGASDDRRCAAKTVPGWNWAAAACSRCPAARTGDAACRSRRSTWRDWDSCCWTTAAKATGTGPAGRLHADRAHRAGRSLKACESFCCANRLQA